ncbi:PAS domain-containing sensor histidine kinase [Sapientia aquatica]|uniref:histidine kinase n=1 Tax=Sapientia aquatica TaxID=1549640 RepID=A0A4R5W4L3_9BURK|nr:PAS domain-containing sensor histidine kinase [Sapientia aquatica]TDK66618.1 PAS domain-containing sensor histidine kinase [Sapientia aquatica]
MDTEKLQWQEQQFHQIVEMAPNAIALINEQGIIEVANKQMEIIFGYSRQELIGQPLAILLPASIKVRHQQHQQTFFSNPHARSLRDRGDLYGRRKNGTEVALEIGLNPIHTDKGKKVIATVIDVSERTRYLHELHELTELRQAILDSSNFSIICANSEGLIQIFNKSAERMLGYTEDEIVHKQTPAIFHDVNEVIIRAVELSEELGMEIEPGFDAFVAKSRIKREPDEHEWTYIHKNGTRIPVLLSVTALINKDNDISGYLGMAVDLREQKKQERQLHDNQEFFRALYENSLDAHMQTDITKGFIGANAAALKLFGCTDIEEFLALSPTELSPEYQSDGQLSSEKALAMMITAMQTGSHKFEWLHQRVDGTQFDAEVVLVRMTIGGKDLLQGTVRDISERKRAEQIKNAFISTVSHELRTPLTSISGVLGLVEQGVLGAIPDAALSMIKMAHRNSLRLSDLINDLLDIEKLAAGQMIFEMQEQRLMPLIQQAVNSLTTYFLQFKVNCTINALIDPTIYVDERRIIQVLTNFLSNAAKFSYEGGQIEVVVKLLDGNINPLVRVAVIDHGIGMQDNFKVKIFQKFSQEDTSDTRKKGGTGLGLAICKELIERMHGQIGFESNHNQGSCFYFDLPLKLSL